MYLLLLSFALFAAGGAASALAGRRPGWAAQAGAGGAVLGCAAGLGASLAGLSGETGAILLPWPLPFGSLALGLDPLTAFFLLPLFLLGAAAAVFGAGYMPGHGGGHGRGSGIGAHWLLFNLLLASMALVLAARDGLLFLMAWETMSLASFFLVTTEDEKESVRFAGWVYLTATHLSSFFLLALFLLLGKEGGSLAFDGFGSLPAGVPPTALFLLALAGFGTKAGLFPLHLWLPEAHPAAPSHVSALMSGVMVATGFYGILRTLSFLGEPPLLWGGILLGAGALTAVMGALYALAQRDLKRALAYSTVENMGMAAMGLGTGLLCGSAGRPDLGVLGTAAALIHLFNHSLMKGGLFLGAGAVLHETRTLAMERLGGLLSRMPWTGGAFAAASAAIAALPPFNGFAGEFLLALALLSAGQALTGGGAVGAWSALATLGLTGGLAAAGAVRMFGTAFLGEARSADATGARECGWLMRGPVLALAAACLLLGVLSPLLLPAISPILAPAGAPAGEGASLSLAGASDALWGVAWTSLALMALLLLLAAARTLITRGRPAVKGPTWGCGYALPTPRMQYTASSFAQPLTALVARLLGSERRVTLPRGLFPHHASFASETPDGPTRHLFGPVFQAAEWLARRLRVLQHGRVHLYVLAIVLTLVALLLFRMG